MRRGTDWTVPIVPGFVSVTVTPAKSSGAILLVRTLRMSSSYAAQNPRKSSVSASRMHGTRSVREPSAFSRSTARPRPMRSRRMTRGLPSGSVAKAEFITGIVSAIARTTAKPIRCVKLTFPPRVRAR
jgi:hypothetical protein